MLKENGRNELVITKMGWLKLAGFIITITLLVFAGGRWLGGTDSDIHQIKKNMLTRADVEEIVKDQLEVCVGPIKEDVHELRTGLTRCHETSDALRETLIQHLVEEAKNR